MPPSGSLDLPASPCRQLLERELHSAKLIITPNNNIRWSIVIENSSSVKKRDIILNFATIAWPMAAMSDSLAKTSEACGLLFVTFKVSRKIKTCSKPNPPTGRDRATFNVAAITWRYSLIQIDSSYVDLAAIE